MLKVKTRNISFFIILGIYIVAFFIGFIVFYFLRNANIHNQDIRNANILLPTFIADLTATLVVWGSGLLFANSSVYDPYWSVAPIALVALWVIENRILSLSITGVLFSAALIIWGSRLTLNWALRWKGLNHEDWRYTMLKGKSPRLWFITNLIGINVMPTIIVFIAMIPVYFGISANESSKKSNISILAIAGFIICIGAVLIQSIADIQMDLFKKDNKSKNHFIYKGLWKYSRHPNYLGEILFWWGIWLMQIGAAPKLWLTIIGPIIIILLFIFISIPMMEKHILTSKSDYHGYRKKVFMLVPWFKIKK